MSWKKHFTVYKFANQQGDHSGPPAGRYSKFSNYLPEVYSGQPNRVERYFQYDQMDADSEINAALDTISEFSTQFDDDQRIPFNIKWNDDSTDSEVSVLEKALSQWNRINEWDKRIFRIMRSTLKYGDQFFIRDPETYVWMWVNPADVPKVIINDSEGKKIEQYVVRNLDLNLQEKTASTILQHNEQYMSVSTMMSGGVVNRGAYGSGGNTGTNAQQEEFGIDANHVIHLSLTEGMDANWPFGTSILDPVFKTYKQKELLEDSIIIYRVQRAPERRVFYIDVGSMPTHKAMSFVERVKNEIHQRRIPNKTGGGNSIMDASYNPLSIMEDYFFAQSAEGRGSKVEVLPGGENLGQIDDLKYFTNKLLRALRIPSSYLPTGPDDGTASFVDGRVGTAFIQEYRFTKYCQRLQQLLGPHFDKEFKMFCKFKGINVDSSIFELQFMDPQSFSQYRQIEIEGARAGVFNQLAEVPYMSRRFALKKYLAWEEDDIVENETMWKEENPDKVPTGSGGVSGGGPSDTLGAVGLRPPDLEAPGEDTLPEEGFEGEEQPDMGGTESPISGSEGTLPPGEVPQ